LLDEEAFPNYKSIVKEQVAPFVIRNRKREVIDNEGNRLFKNRFTKVVEIHWDEKHSMQRNYMKWLLIMFEMDIIKHYKEKKFYIGF
jgi:hypothetical protein